MKRRAAAILIPILLTLLILFAVEYTKGRKGFSGIRIANSDAAAENIRTGLKHRAWKLHITFRCHTKEDRDIKRMMDDLLEQALYESEDPAGGDYIRCQLGGYRMHYDIKRVFLGYQCHMELMPAYYSTRDEEEYVDAEIGRILTQLAQDAGRQQRQGSGSFDESSGDEADALKALTAEKKIRLVHDYVTDLLSYDSVHKDKENSHAKVTAYAALRYHQVVCQGYAVLTYRLLKEMGVPCRIETGDAVIDGVKERHAWLRVSVDGRELYMDPTLDDVNSCYDWFLITADEFGKDHEIVRDLHCPEG